MPDFRLGHANPATGPLGAITGASLSGGASYSDMLYRSPEREEGAHATALDALGQAAGAIPAIFLNGATGVDQWAKGDVERGIEHMVPPAIGGLM